MDAIATATQDRRYLRGEPDADNVAIDAILMNGEKAIRVALNRFAAEVTAREAATWAAGAAVMRDIFATMCADLEWLNLEVAIRALPLPPMPGTTQGGNADE